MIEKPAGNPRVMPLTPRTSTRHVATLRVAPPLSIKLGTEPQESQTAQENFSSFVIIMTRHTTEPGGQLMGMTRLHPTDKDNTTNEESTHDEVVLNNEETNHH